MALKTTSHPRAGLLRIPALDSASRPWIGGEVGRRRPIHLGDHRRGGAVEKVLDAASGRHKRRREVGQGRLADDDEEPHSLWWTTAASSFGL